MKIKRTVRSVMKQYGFSHNEEFPDYLWVEKMAFEWKMMSNNIDNQIKLRHRLTRPK